MSNIDRQSPVPLYFQLKQMLLAKIESGEWQPGDLIPGELDLQDTFGLSRTTVRQTLGELVSEGHLERFRGRGTFVAQSSKIKMTFDPSGERGLHEALTMEGYTPGWELVSQGWVENAPADVRDHLGVDTSQKVYRLVRKRLADNHAIGYHVAWLPEAIGNRINHLTLTTGESKSYLMNLPEMQNAHASRTIEALSANAQDAEMLGCALGEPILQVQRLVLVNNTGVEFLNARYLGRRFKYQVMRPL